MKFKKKGYASLSDSLLMLFFGYCEINVQDRTEDALNILIKYKIRFSRLESADGSIGFRIFLAEKRRVSYLVVSHSAKNDIHFVKIVVVRLNGIVGKCKGAYK